MNKYSASDDVIARCDLGFGAFWICLGCSARFDSEDELGRHVRLPEHRFAELPEGPKISNIKYLAS
jgi:hypothetical protein